MRALAGMPWPDTDAPTTSGGVALSSLTKVIVVASLVRSVAVSANDPLEFTIPVSGSAFRANSLLCWESCCVVKSSAGILVLGKISDDHHLVDWGTWLKP